MASVSTVWTQVIWCCLAIAAATMFGLWLIERKHTYIAIIGVAPVSLLVGMMANIFPIAAPYRIATNALFSLLAVVFATEGWSRRAGERLGRICTLIPAGAGAIGVFALAATHQDLACELRLQDLTFAYIGACGIYYARLLTNGRRGDRLLGLTILAGIVYFLTRSWFGLDRDALYSGTHSSFDVFTPPFVIFFVAIIVANTATYTVQEVSTVIDRLRRERDTDVLTGALNRRGFEAGVGRLLDSPGHVPSSFVVFDLDDFKPINDQYGHVAGDQVLREFGALLRASVRETDVIGRLGGDEFAVYLTGQSYPEALAVAERIRANLALVLAEKIPDTGSLTVSFGIASTAQHPEFAELLSAADHRLYGSKRARKPRTKQS